MLDTVFRTAARGSRGDLPGTRTLLARYLLAGVAAGALLGAPLLGTAHAADMATKAPAAAAPGRRDAQRDGQVAATEGRGGSSGVRVIRGN